MGGNSFSRAYFAFRDPQEVVNFRDRWDGYVFLDDRGQEYMAIVEFAPFQKMPRKKPKKPDNKSGTIEQGKPFIIITFLFLLNIIIIIIFFIIIISI